VLYQKVLDGSLDAAIIVAPPFTLSKSCDWQLFREEPLIVLTSRSEIERDVRTILTRARFIRLDPATWAGRLVDGYLRQARIRPRERYQFGDLEAIAVMVDRGLGVSLVPDWSPPWPEGLVLRKLSVGDHSFSRRIGLVWSRTCVRLTLVHAFLREAATVIDIPRGASKKARPASMRRRVAIADRRAIR